METVTVKGKVYQIGWPYRSVDNGRLGYLLHHHKGNGFRLCVDPNLSGACWYCAQLEGFTAGTITDAPIELEDGEWYMCDLASGQSVLTWDQDTETWLYSDGEQFQEVENTPIPLYKMVRERT